jgi:hypothetical protein
MASLSVVGSVLMFVGAKVIPALFRVSVAVIVWLFTFTEAHHAAILACLSFFGTLILHVDSWALTLAKAALAYFGTSAFAGLVRLFKGEQQMVAGKWVATPLLNIREVIAGEVSRVQVAYHNWTFRPSPKPAPAK